MHHSYIQAKNNAATAWNQSGLAIREATTEYEKNMAQAVHFLSKAVEDLIELQGNETEARSKASE